MFRLIRFGSEAALATIYGPEKLVRDIAYFFTVLLVGVSVISIIKFAGYARHRRVGDPLGKKEES